MSLKLFCAISCFTLLAAAAPPPGTVAASGPFKLNGIDIPATAAASTPIRLGDEITTGESATVIRWDGYGAVITLAPHSCIQTGEFEGKPFIRLTAGSVEYKLTPESKLLIFKRTEAVKTAATGVVRISSHTKPIVVAAAGGAAVVVTSVALAKRSPTCPDGANNCGK